MTYRFLLIGFHLFAVPRVVCNAQLGLRDERRASLWRLLHHATHNCLIMGITVDYAQHRGDMQARSVEKGGSWRSARELIQRWIPFLAVPSHAGMALTHKNFRFVKAFQSGERLRHIAKQASGQWPRKNSWHRDTCGHRQSRTVWSSFEVLGHRLRTHLRVSSYCLHLVLPRPSSPVAYKSTCLPPRSHLHTAISSTITSQCLPTNTNKTHGLRHRTRCERFTEIHCQ